MTEKTTTTIVTGLRSGHVTDQKRFQPLAPSSDDASWRSGLIVCSPASSGIAKNGMPRHVLTTIAHHMPYVPSYMNASLERVYSSGVAVSVDRKCTRLKY